MSNLAGSLESEELMMSRQISTETVMTIDLSRLDSEKKEKMTSRKNTEIVEFQEEKTKRKNEKKNLKIDQLVKILEINYGLEIVDTDNFLENNFAENSIKQKDFQDLVIRKFDNSLQSTIDNSFENGEFTCNLTTAEDDILVYEVLLTIGLANYYYLKVKFSKNLDAYFHSLGFQLVGVMVLSKIGCEQMVEGIINNNNWLLDNQ